MFTVFCKSNDCERCIVEERLAAEMSIVTQKDKVQLHAFAFAGSLTDQRQEIGEQVGLEFSYILQLIYNLNTYFK